MSTKTKAKAPKAPIAAPPVHTPEACRAVMMEFIERYRIRHTTKHASVHHWRKANDAFWDAHTRLRNMVLENHGLSTEVDHYGDETIGLAARSFDLGDVMVIVAADATADELASQHAGVVLLPKSARCSRYWTDCPSRTLTISMKMWKTRTQRPRIHHHHTRGYHHGNASSSSSTFCESTDR